MKGSIVLRPFKCLVIAGLLCAVTAMSEIPTARADPSATVGLTDVAQPVSSNVEFNRPGANHVSTTQVTADCADSLYGNIVRVAAFAMGNRTDPTCSTVFPSGLQSPVGTKMYYPEDAANSERHPAVLFTGGILSEPGNYDYLANLWASHGFVVVVAYDYINSFVAMPTLAAATLVAADRTPHSPLFGRIDLTRVVLAGHSAGGQAAQQASALAPSLESLFDPDLKIIGLMPIEPGPTALGTLIELPMLMLTGSSDIIVPQWSWPKITQYGLANQSPAYFAIGLGATHLTPIESGQANTFGGITTAWLLHLAGGNPVADSYFTGPDWKLRKDIQFYGVQRNMAAGN